MDKKVDEVVLFTTYMRKGWQISGFENTWSTRRISAPLQVPDASTKESRLNEGYRPF